MHFPLLLASLRYIWSARDQCDRSTDIDLSPVDRAAEPQDVPHGAYDEPESDPDANA